MKELIYLLNSYNIPFKKSVYGYDDKSIIISNKKYQLEIYESKTDNHLVSDLQEIPYNWGRMGSTTLEEIKEDLTKYFNYKFDYMQTTLFDFIEEEKMNKEIEMLNKKIDAQDKIINTQALEIANLKVKNTHIEQLWKETNVIIRNEKTLAINDNAMNYILSLEQKIDKAIEYIRETGLYCDYGDLCNQSATELLKILGDKE